MRCAHTEQRGSYPTPPSRPRVDAANSTYTGPRQKRATPQARSGGRESGCMWSASRVGLHGWQCSPRWAPHGHCTWPHRAHGRTIIITGKHRDEYPCGRQRLRRRKRWQRNSSVQAGEGARGGDSGARHNGRVVAVAGAGAPRSNGAPTVPAPGSTHAREPRTPKARRLEQTTQCHRPETAAPRTHCRRRPDRTGWRRVEPPSAHPCTWTGAGYHQPAGAKTQPHDAQQP
jgi:hypothetical protein